MRSHAFTLAAREAGKSGISFCRERWKQRSGDSLSRGRFWAVKKEERCSLGMASRAHLHSALWLFLLARNNRESRASPNLSSPAATLLGEPCLRCLAPVYDELSVLLAQFHYRSSWVLVLILVFLWVNYSFVVSACILLKAAQQRRQCYMIWPHHSPQYLSTAPWAPATLISPTASGIFRVPCSSGLLLTCSPLPGIDLPSTCHDLLPHLIQLFAQMSPLLNDFSQLLDLKQ